MLPLATTGMIAGLAYLLEMFRERKGSRFGIMEAQKNRAVAYLVRRAKGKSKLICFGAIGVIFLILVFYYSIGKKVEFNSSELAEA